MLEFFEALGAFDWGEGVTEPPEGFDVTGEVENVEEKGLAMMLSFIGLQDQAERLMEALRQIMEFIQPFLNLFGDVIDGAFWALGILVEKFGGDSSGLDNLFRQTTSVALNIINQIINALLGEGAPFYGIGSGLSLELPTFNAIDNFFYYSSKKLQGLSLQSNILALWNAIKSVLQNQPLVLCIAVILSISTLFLSYIAIGTSGLGTAALETIGLALAIYGCIEYKNTGQMEKALLAVVVGAIMVPSWFLTCFFAPPELIGLIVRILASTELIFAFLIMVANL